MSAQYWCPPDWWQGNSSTGAAPTIVRLESRQRLDLGLLATLEAHQMFLRLPEALARPGIESPGKRSTYLQAGGRWEVPEEGAAAEVPQHLPPGGQVAQVDVGAATQPVVVVPRILPQQHLHHLHHTQGTLDIRRDTFMLHCDSSCCTAVSAEGTLVMAPTWEHGTTSTTPPHSQV